VVGVVEVLLDGRVDSWSAADVERFHEQVVADLRVEVVTLLVYSVRPRW
jgi:hypothetical protein